jgi:shikimate kinase
VPGGQPRNVFLIGYRGTGKTTMAELLAAALGWQWTDSDQELENRHGCTIVELFARGDEKNFRRLESALLEELCRRSRQVIATGGGAILSPDNRVRLKASGHVVWLQADPATIWHRLRMDPTTAARRPDLTTGGLVEIEELLHLREPLYRGCADMMVDTGNRSPEQVLKMILTGLPFGEK